MAKSMTAATLLASTSNAANATTNGSSTNNQTTFGGTITFRITNGATGPTLGAICEVQVSNDNSDWFTMPVGRAGNGNSEVTELFFDVSSKYMYFRPRVRDNTGQAVTAFISYQELTVAS